MTSIPTGAAKVAEYRAFTSGTTAYHKSPFLGPEDTRAIYYTDGILLAREELGAEWLPSVIALLQPTIGDDEPFQVWTVDREDDGRLSISAHDGGKGGRPAETLVRRVLGHLSFPKEALPFEVWAEHGHVNDGPAVVIMLAEER